jgi:hypothetical protein
MYSIHSQEMCRWFQQERLPSVADTGESNQRLCIPSVLTQTNKIIVGKFVNKLFNDWWWSSKRRVFFFTSIVREMIRWAEAKRVLPFRRTSDSFRLSCYFVKWSTSAKWFLPEKQTVKYLFKEVVGLNSKPWVSRISCSNLLLSTFHQIIILIFRAWVSELTAFFTL